MKTENFAAFILTHGRPDAVFTVASLKRHGYTGKVFIVIDNEDKAADEYRKNFGDQVVMFDKLAVSETFDEGDNFGDRRAIIYARNACFEIAKEKGIQYFIQLDDDYVDFRFKFNSAGDYGDWLMRGGLDRVLKAMLDYYRSIPALSIAMAQGGDFIGGANGSSADRHMKRKCMNTFICAVDRPFQFFGRINEDVNTYTNLGGRGGLFLTIPNVAIQQKQTQSNAGGMTDLYLDSGTYVKSFYSVMYSPSCVDIRVMGSKHKRLHHRVAWKNAVPVILDDGYKFV